MSDPTPTPDPVPPIPAGQPPGTLTTFPSATGPREPVRIAYAIFTFVQAVIVVLAASEVLSAKATALTTGLATAAYALCQELLVRPNVSSNYTVAREVTAALYQPVPDTPPPRV